MSNDTDHLVALQVRLSHDRVRLLNAKSDKERELRKVWVAQCEKEIASEMSFLEMDLEDSFKEMSDDEILSELNK